MGKQLESGMAGRQEQGAAAAPPGREVKRSRSIFSYYLPVIVAAMAAIVLFTYTASWLSNQAATERLERLAATLARAVQQQVAEAVRDRTGMLRLLAARPDVTAAVSRGTGLEELETRLRRALPEARMVVPVPVQWKDEQVLEALSGSYAAADLARAVAESRKVQPAQVIRGPDGRQLMLLGAPVVADGRLVGVLVAAWPLDVLRRRIEALELQEAFLAVEQVLGNNRLQLAVTGDAGRRDEDGTLAVPGTLWQVRYGAPPRAGIAWTLLLALAGGGALLLLGVTLLGYRSLARDCRADMGMMVALVDATLKRVGAATPRPHLVEAQPAIELLARYAQATYAAAKAGRAREPAAQKGMEVREEAPVRNGGAAGPEPAPEPPPALDEQRLPLALFSGGLVRGRSGMDLDEEVARVVGLAVGSLVRESGGARVAVARDNRATSDGYAGALVAGLLASGCDVTDLGEAPAPLLNFAMRNTEATSGVMVTGGHNPPEYNGFKIYLEGQPLSEQALLELRQRILEGRFERGAGQLGSRDPSAEYVSRVAADIQLVEPLKVVVDAGNGVAGGLAQQVFEALGCEVIPLCCEPDGGFPNHLPDPSDPRNLELLAQEVRNRGAHLGIALDVDGDALGMVDETGAVVWPDLLLMALAGDVIRRNPGADVVYDVASTAQLPEFILSNGGRPIMWRTGHAEIQAKLRESHGLLGGEFSGHLYLNDRWYGFDDGIYAAARLLELFSLNAGSVSQLFAPYRDGLVATPLLVLETPAGRAEEVVRIMAREGDFDEADVIDLDGLRVEFEEAWGLVRPSRTRPALVFRFEARDQAALDEVQARFRELLRRAAPELEAPF